MKGTNVLYPAFKLDKQDARRLKEQLKCKQARTRKNQRQRQDISQAKLPPDIVIREGQATYYAEQREQAICDMGEALQCSLVYLRGILAKYSLENILRLLTLIQQRNMKP